MRMYTQEKIASITKEAENGVLSAMKELSHMYCTGTGVERSIPLAAKWKKAYIDSLVDTKEGRKEIIGALYEYKEILLEDPKNTSENLISPAECIPFDLMEAIQSVNELTYYLEQELIENSETDKVSMALISEYLWLFCVTKNNYISDKSRISVESPIYQKLLRWITRANELAIINYNNKQQFVKQLQDKNALIGYRYLWADYWISCQYMAELLEYNTETIQEANKYAQLKVELMEEWAVLSNGYFNIFQVLRTEYRNLIDLYMNNKNNSAAKELANKAVKLGEFLVSSDDEEMRTLGKEWLYFGNFKLIEIFEKEDNQEEIEKIVNSDLIQGYVEEMKKNMEEFEKNMED